MGVGTRVRGDKLAALLGVEALPVILPSEPLAKQHHGEGSSRGPSEGSTGRRSQIQEDGLGDCRHPSGQIRHWILLHVSDGGTSRWRHN